MDLGRVKAEYTDHFRWEIQQLGSGEEFTNVYEIVGTTAGD